MPKNLVFCLLISTLFSQSSDLLSQDRQYQRKSISSLGAVLFKEKIDKAAVDLIMNRLKYHLEIPRFDYNGLSPEAVSKFVADANSTDLSAQNIARSLDKTIIPELEKAITLVAEERAKGNLKEEDLARAAVDKMKGSGLTVQDVMNVMNSAYLYLPVVTEFQTAIKSGEAKSIIKGYVLWYQMKKKSINFGAEIIVNSKEEFNGEGTGKLNNKYKLKRRSVNGEIYSQVVAVDTWAKNLSVKMKEIPDFRLSAEIKGILGKAVEANLGTKEGISLDDGFNIVDFFEDEQGDVTANDQGFFRVYSVADNSKQSQTFSSFSKYFGVEPEGGMILYERPRLGIDISIRPKYFTFTLPRYATPVITNTLLLSIMNGGLSVTSPDVWDFHPSNPIRGHGFILIDKSTSGFGADINFNKNVAAMTGVRQLFINADFSVGLPNATLDEKALAGGTTAPLLLSGYIGVMKKFWFGRTNINMAAAGGVDMLRLQNAPVYTGDFDNLTLYAPGVKVDAGFEFLAASDWSFSVNAGYKIGLSPLKATVSFKDVGDIDITPVLTQGFFKGFNEIDFSGFSISAGVTYALPSLPFNPFAFLSSSEIDY